MKHMEDFFFKFQSGLVFVFVASVEISLKKKTKVGRTPKQREIGEKQTRRRIEFFCFSSCLN